MVLLVTPRGCEEAGLHATARQPGLDRTGSPSVFRTADLAPACLTLDLSPVPQGGLRRRRHGRSIRPAQPRRAGPAGDVAGGRVCMRVRVCVSGRVRAGVVRSRGLHAQPRVAALRAVPRSRQPTHACACVFPCAGIRGAESLPGVARLAAKAVPSVRLQRAPGDLPPLQGPRRHPAAMRAQRSAARDTPPPLARTMRSLTGQYPPRKPPGRRWLLSGLAVGPPSGRRSRRKATRFTPPSPRPWQPRASRWSCRSEASPRQKAVVVMAESSGN
jgi:hypothetical protein